MPAIALPAELTIYTAAELRTQWLEWVAALDPADAGDALVDAAAVDQVDAAGVQLLAALVRSIAATGLGWRLDAPSDALRAACTTLGLERLLAGQPVVEGADA